MAMKIKKSRLKEIIKEEVGRFLQEEMDLTLQDVIEGASRALYVSAWADAMEEKGKTFPGEELMDVAPETSPEAKQSALKLIQSVEEENGVDLAEFLEENFPEEDPEEFGFYLAMQAIGSGASWSDDHEEHNLKIPYWEFHTELEEE